LKEDAHHEGYIYLIQNIQQKNSNIILWKIVTSYTLKNAGLF